MAWSFRKRVKIIPGVHLNFSKSGISTSIGVKGANVTFGKSGTYLNTSIPGLGLYNRQKISSTANDPKSLPSQFQYISELPENIFSADVQEITSQDMEGIRQAIFAAREERKELSKDILKVKSALTTSKVKLASSYVLVYGLIKKTISQNIKEDIKSQKDTLICLQDCLENCYVKIDIDFDAEIKEKYNRLVKSFKNVLTSRKIWDVTSAHFENRPQTRSAASTVVQRKDVKFGFRNIPEIKTEFSALYFQNANGADIYFYPGFIIMYKSKDNFALIGYNELDYSFSSTRFVEEDSVPADSKIIDRTWKKVNKNGTPDKRFKGNYQIPIVRYGTINLRTHTGMNEEYSLSNYEFAEEFSRNFLEYQLTIKSLSQLTDNKALNITEKRDDNNNKMNGDEEYKGIMLIEPSNNFFSVSRDDYPLTIHKWYKRNNSIILKGETIVDFHTKNHSKEILKKVIIEYAEVNGKLVQLKPVGYAPIDKEVFYVIKSIDESNIEDEIRKRILSIELTELERTDDDKIYFINQDFKEVYAQLSIDSFTKEKKIKTQLIKVIFQPNNIEIEFGFLKENDTNILIIKGYRKYKVLDKEDHVQILFDNDYILNLQFKNNPYEVARDNDGIIVENKILLSNEDFSIFLNNLISKIKITDSKTNTSIDGISKDKIKKIELQENLISIAKILEQNV